MNVSAYKVEFPVCSKILEHVMHLDISDEHVMWLKIKNSVTYYMLCDTI